MINAIFDTFNIFTSLAIETRIDHYTGRGFLVYGRLVCEFLSLPPPSGSSSPQAVAISLSPCHPLDLVCGCTVGPDKGQVELLVDPAQGGARA